MNNGSMKIVLYRDRNGTTCDTCNMSLGERGYAEPGGSDTQNVSESLPWVIVECQNPCSSGSMLTFSTKFHVRISLSILLYKGMSESWGCKMSHQNSQGCPFL